MADMIEQKISDPEPWTNKILCRYREAPPIKQFLREGEDRVLVAEITRLRQLLSEAEKREREARAKAVEEVLSALTAHELYQYRPKAFQGFIEYARREFGHAPVYNQSVENGESGDE